MKVELQIYLSSINWAPVWERLLTRATKYHFLSSSFAFFYVNNLTEMKNGTSSIKTCIKTVVKSFIKKKYELQMPLWLSNKCNGNEMSKIHFSKSNSVVAFYFSLMLNSEQNLARAHFTSILIQIKTKNQKKNIL